jgi:uncharacterized protein (TIGR00297 family)
MGFMPSNLAFGVCLAALISTGAFAVGALTVRAAVASTALGAIVFVAGGVAWSVPLLTFFVSSSLLSRRELGTTPKAITETSRRRTARQVLANGFMPGLWAACHGLFPGYTWTVLFASALATATADTWATEIGRRSSGSPRDALTGRRVAAGTSGGITVSGLAASLAGTTTLTASCLVTGIIGPPAVPAIALAGFGGALVDSLLGASLQERRWCPGCLEETEDAIHAQCSRSTSHLHGVRGFDNDWVNLSSDGCGSALGLAFTYLL